MGEALLIGRIPVRAFELEQVFRHVSMQPGVCFGDLAERFSPLPLTTLEQGYPLLKEVLGFLQGAGLIQDNGARIWSDRRYWATHIPDLPFTLTLLRAMRALSDPKQRAVATVHDLLTLDGVLYTSIPEIVERMEQSKVGLFAWNTTKVNFWAAIYEAIGLVVRHVPERVALSPHSALLLSALPPGPTPIQTALALVEQEYFACFTRRQTLHPGLERALLRLEREGKVRLSYRSDAPGSLFVAGRRVSHVALA